MAAKTPSKARQLTFYGWNGDKLTKIGEKQTKNKYDDAADALKEFKIGNGDMIIRNFPQFNQYR